MGADKYDDYDWKELPPEVQAAATTLGYTKKMWDKDKGEALALRDFHRAEIIGRPSGVSRFSPLS